MGLVFTYGDFRLKTVSLKLQIQETLILGGGGGGVMQFVGFNFFLGFFKKVNFTLFLSSPVF